MALDRSLTAIYNHMLTDSHDDDDGHFNNDHHDHDDNNNEDDVRMMFKMCSILKNDVS